ncbi:MAG: UDP-N-acetylmuramoyl-L-alanine--D-glutamate ligase, partial [Odoribacter sp.]|nr:UDP-N-acetylmuramoyl-L-alanine--D-glutamate ligase [Odoribacter sp.]
MKLVVLGGGESGVGAALLGKKLGYEVFLSDKGALAEKYREVLLKQGVEFEEGHHSEERIFAADLVVKSPGIPETVPMIVRLRERGVEVISEIEFAGRHTSARFVCITGSN